MSTAAVTETAAAAARPLKPQSNAATATSPTATGPSLTQKQWVVPPRPKPGRKPATDTPATKRKAQNRVAQRAFRERKAAKIGELEEERAERARVHAAEVADLQSQIASLSQKLDQQLTGEVGHFARDVSALHAELEQWRAAYSQEKNAREGLERELAILRGEAVSLPPRQHHGSRPSDGVLSYRTPDEMPLGCHQCSLSHCQCLEDALNVTSTQEAPVKRPLSPASASTGPGKKARASIDAATVATAATGPDDGCGFCTEGSTCLCAELEADRRHGTPPPPPPNLPSPPSDAVHTEIDFTTAFAQPAPPTGNCPAGPGSCSQCQRDPARALFCKTLAAARSPAPPPAAIPAVTTPCAAGSACCRISTATLAAQAGPTSSRASPPPLTVSCADAFNTLQQHPGFARASREIGEWLPQLTTVPTGKGTATGSTDIRGGAAGPAAPPPERSGAGTAAHTAFEIETASILGVLRFFDRQFGREA